MTEKNHKRLHRFTSAYEHLKYGVFLALNGKINFRTEGNAQYEEHHSRNYVNSSLRMIANTPVLAGPLANKK